MSAVYTRRLFTAGTASTLTTVTVPPGRVWVVRCVTLTCRTLHGGDAGYAVINGGFIFFGDTFQAGQRAPSSVWLGYLGVNAGETLGVLPSANSQWDMTASGYDFAA